MHLYPLMTQTVSSTNSQFVDHTSRLQILCTAGSWLIHLLLSPKAALPVWWFVCHRGVILKHVWLADSPSTCQGPTILCFEFKVIFIPSPLLPQHLCLHKDVFMYVCMCSREHREFFFLRVGGDKRRNLRLVNMDGVPALREHRW